MVLSASLKALKEGAEWCRSRPEFKDPRRSASVWGQAEMISQLKQKKLFILISNSCSMQGPQQIR